MAREVSFCVFTTHAVDRDDQTPCRLVSDDLLAHYRRCETVAAALAGVVIGAVIAAGITFLCGIPTL